MFTFSFYLQVMLTAGTRTEPDCGLPSACTAVSSRELIGLLLRIDIAKCILCHYPLESE